MSYARTDPEVRFLRKIRVDENGCWRWVGAHYLNGYAIFCRGGKGNPCIAHRWSYENFVGPIPEGWTIDHLCRVRDCVNPKHLEAVEFRENVLRGFGPSGKNARKTHCPKGHPLEDGYLHGPRGDWRRCRACNTENARRYRARKRAA